MHIQPLHDWAVIRPAEAESISSGGLYIPDSAKEKPHEGVVVAIGPGALEPEKFGKKKTDQKERRFIPTSLKPGERVLYEKYAGKSYTIGREDLVLVRERDVLGILPERTTEPPRPLQIPASTTGERTVALVKSDPAATKDLIVHKPAVTRTAAPVKKKSVKKAAKKKTVKKAVKNKAIKAAKKTTKKSAKKTLKKTAKKPVKRTGSPKKAAKKAAGKKSRK